MNRHCLARSSSILSSVALCTVLCGESLAFGSDEHREISDLALRVAIDFVCRDENTSSGSSSRNCHEIRRVATQFDEPNPSYGMINELVDYMTHPEQIFERFDQSTPRESDGIPKSSENLNQHIFAIWEARNRASFTNNALSIASQTFDYFEASSDNERHFQHALLESMHQMHQTAMSTAQAGHLYKALVESAMSDHYLNDFFAPGHITTPRENSHDTVALAMHDRANRAGICFRVDQARWTELSEILDFIRDEHLRREYRIVLSERIESDRDIAQLSENLLRCGHTYESQLTLSAFETENQHEWPQSQQSFQAELVEEFATEHNQVFLQGDGRLVHNPRQRLFLLLVQVKSISEMLNSYLGCNSGSNDPCPSPHELTTFYEWRGTYDFTEEKIQDPNARIRHGGYEFVYDLEDDAQSERVWWLLKRPRDAYPVVADDALLISFGGQSPVSQESSRFEFQAELFPMALGTANFFNRWRALTIQRPSSYCTRFLCNVGLAYGLTYVNDDYFSNTNLQLRFIKAVPKISGMFSFALRRGEYRGDFEDHTRWTYGLRYDHGFSMHTFYIGYQRDYVFDERGRFDRDNMITFGWTISAPLSRIRDFFGGYR